MLAILLIFLVYIKWEMSNIDRGKGALIALPFCGSRVTSRGSKKLKIKKKIYKNGNRNKN